MQPTLSNTSLDRITEAQRNSPHGSTVAPPCTSEVPCLSHHPTLSYIHPLSVGGKGLHQGAYPWQPYKHFLHPSRLFPRDHYTPIPECLHWQHRCPHGWEKHSAVNRSRPAALDTLNIRSCYIVITQEHPHSPQRLPSRTTAHKITLELLTSTIHFNPRCIHSPATTHIVPAVLGGSSSDPKSQRRTYQWRGTCQCTHGPHLPPPHFPPYSSCSQDFRLVNLPPPPHSDSTEITMKLFRSVIICKAEHSKSVTVKR